MDDRRVNVQREIFEVHLSSSVVNKFRTGGWSDGVQVIAGAAKLIPED